MKNGLLKTGLLVAVTTISAAGIARAQGYGAPGYGAREELEVIAPRFREEGSRLSGAPEKVSLSTRVRYDDLDLRTWRGAWALRRRVRAAAWNACATLADAYPFYTANGTSCYKSALENALLRADEAIDEARIAYRTYGE